jgi:hypothetical protein
MKLICVDSVPAAFVNKIAGKRWLEGLRQTTIVGALHGAGGQRFMMAEAP